MFRSLLSALTLVLLTCNLSMGTVVQLEFDNPAPGTLADSTGQGTGFTVRLPGSGSSIPANDPNLTLDTANGHLLVNSTRSDFNITGFGRNLPAMEAPAILINGVGASDFIMRAKFLDVHADQLSDQMGVFVGTSVDNVLRGMALEENSPGNYQAGFNWSQNGADGAPNGGALDAFQSGSDIVLELGRIGGLWHFLWQNLDAPQFNGSVGSFTVPGIDSANDLYFGIFNFDARNTIPQLATLEYFEVLTGASVPESACLAGWAFSLLGVSLCLARTKGALLRCRG